MGRAKSRVLAAAATASNFNAVLGRNRGSADAQAQRDLSERLAFSQSHQQRAATLKQYELMVDSYFTDFKVDDVNRGHVIVDTLAGFYQKGEEVAKLMRFLLRALNTDEGLREIRAVVEFGDPAGWPGFTQPALQTLGSFFATPPAAHKRAHMRKQAEHFLRALESALEEQEEDDYERWQPLCEGLAVFFEGETKKDGEYITGATRHVFGYASEEVLAGPLRSLVSTVAARHITGKTTKHERLLMHEDMTGGDTVLEAAFAAIPTRYRYKPQ